MRRLPPDFKKIFFMAILLIAGFDVSSGCAAQPLSGVDKTGAPAMAASAVKPGVGSGGQSARPVSAQGLKNTVPPAGYSYNTRGKADPFKPFMETDAEVIKKKAEEQKNKKIKALTNVINPLQKEDIGKYSLVGIIGDVKRRTAIVEDKAAKRHYPIFVGTYIGQNGGMVAAILVDRLIVEERAGDDQEKSKNKKGINRIEMLLHK